MRRFGNYIYLLEAACNGQGVAIGWSGLVDDYLERRAVNNLAGKATENRWRVLSSGQSFEPKSGPGGAGCRMSACVLRKSGSYAAKGFSLCR